MHRCVENIFSPLAPNAAFIIDVSRQSTMPMHIVIDPYHAAKASVRIAILTNGNQSDSIRGGRPLGDPRLDALLHGCPVALGRQYLSRRIRKSYAAGLREPLFCARSRERECLVPPPILVVLTTIFELGLSISIGWMCARG